MCTSVAVVIGSKQRYRIKSKIDVDGMQVCHNNKGKGKGNIYLYSASLQMPLTSSYMDHTVLPAKNTISPFTRKHFPGGATTHICLANA